MTAEKKDRTRTIEAATGQIDYSETFQVGPWEVGYLSLKNSEVRRMEAAEESGKVSALIDFAYPIFTRRFIGDDPPSQEEFDDETDMREIYAFLAWLNGMDADEARKIAENPRQAVRTKKG